MRRLLLLILVLGSFAFAGSAQAVSGKIVKVLPHFIDEQGRHTKSPSLFDRDAYQAWLRQHPEKRRGVRYDIQWKAKQQQSELMLRVELRGIAEGKLPKEKTLEANVKASTGWARWTDFAVTGDDYKALGEVTAWRVTLWDGDTLVDEQTSFLW
jgi:hypothetical protein